MVLNIACAQGAPVYKFVFHIQLIYYNIVIFYFYMLHNLRNILYQQNGFLVFFIHPLQSGHTVSRYLINKTTLLLFSGSVTTL